MARMTDFQEDLDAFKERLEAVEVTVHTVKTELAENTRITKVVAVGQEAVAKDTGELVEAFKAAKGAWAVLEWLGKAAKPVLWILGAVGLVWGYVGGHLVKFIAMLKGGQ
jgi:Icc-related predicted phosphoesterase